MFIFILLCMCFCTIPSNGHTSLSTALSSSYDVNRPLPSVIQIQDLQTNGAVDATFVSLDPSMHYLIIANHIDNAGRTNINSDIYQWEAANGRFGVVPVQYLPTRGARALTSVRAGGNVYLIVVNHLDSNIGSYHVEYVVFGLLYNNKIHFYSAVFTECSMPLYITCF